MAPAEVKVDGWLFSGPIPYCTECAALLLRELVRTGWTFLFILETIEPVALR